MKKINDQEIISRLKAEFESMEAPDLISEIKAKYNLHPKQIKETAPKKRFVFRMQYVMGLAMVLVMALIVTLSISVNNGNSIDADTSGTTISSSVMALESISAINMFSDDSQVAPVYNEFPPRHGQNNFTPPTEEPANNGETATRIHRFLVLSEQIMDLENSVRVVNEESDFEGYAFKEKVSITTYLGNAVEYVFYYNIISGAQETDAYSFEGVLVFDEVTYNIDGVKDKVSNKNMLKLNVRESQTSWVEVEKDLDNKEEKTSYKVFLNGEKDYDVNIGMKMQNKEMKVNIEYKKDEFTEEFAFEKRQGQNKGMAVTHKAGNEQIQIDVYMVEDPDNQQEMKYEYSFGHGNKYQFDNQFGKKGGPNKGNAN